MQNFQHPEYAFAKEEMFMQQSHTGTYAQDEMGLSDDFVNDVLDGDPDAYWNID